MILDNNIPAPQIKPDIIKRQPASCYVQWEGTVSPLSILAKKSNLSLKKPLSPTTSSQEIIRVRISQGHQPTVRQSHFPLK